MPKKKTEKQKNKKMSLLSHPSKSAQTQGILQRIKFRIQEVGKRKVEDKVQDGRTQKFSRRAEQRTCCFCRIQPSHSPAFQVP
jgi:predicted secreted protein